MLNNWSMRSDIIQIKSDLSLIKGINSQQINNSFGNFTFNVLTSHQYIFRVLESVVCCWVIWSFLFLLFGVPLLLVQSIAMSKYLKCTVLALLYKKSHGHRSILVNIFPAACSINSIRKNILKND